MILSCFSLIMLSTTMGGRSTNKFYSLADGGYHHHGGFLLGYDTFVQGNINNTQESRRYEKFLGEPLGEEETLESHHNHKLRTPVLEETDPRLLLQIPTGRNSSTFFLNKLLNQME